MQECPYCHTRTDKDHLFCRSCGASLKLPEYNRAFCPHCGARVSTRQTFCHECNWPLESQEEDNLPMRRKGRPPGFYYLLWGGGLLSVLILVLFWWRGPASPPAPPALPPEKKVEKPAAIPAVKLPLGPRTGPSEERAAAPGLEISTPSDDLKLQLQAVLNRLREAQIHKDLEKYLNLYASTFPQREEKRAHTLKIWGTYDYTDLEYEVGEIKPLAVDQALARVTWHLQVRNLRNNSTRTLTQTFRVWFSREAGQWRIVRLEALSKEGGEVRKYAQAG